MVSVNFGIYTATVTVPANALPITASVTITLYGTGHGPHTLQSAARSPKSLGANATELAEVAINTGGVAPVLPLKLSLTGVSPLTSGTVIMLAGYGTPNAFTDVDTVTLLSNVASEDDNILYPGASLAANTVYGFYEIAHANVPAPSPTITAITPASAPRGDHDATQCDRDQRQRISVPDPLVHVLDDRLGAGHAHHERLSECRRARRDGPSPGDRHDERPRLAVEYSSTRD